LGVGVCGVVRVQALDRGWVGDGEWEGKSGNEEKEEEAREAHDLRGKECGRFVLEVSGCG